MSNFIIFRRRQAQPSWLLLKIWNHSYNKTFFHTAMRLLHKFDIYQMSELQ